MIGTAPFPTHCLVCLQTNLPTHQRDSYEMEVPPRAGQLQTTSLLPAFTRQREHLVGRVAMLGVCAMWAGEVRGSHCKCQWGTYLMRLSRSMRL